MNNAIVSMARDAFSCAVRQSESGIIKTGWGGLAAIIGHEFSAPVARTKPELMDLDFDEIFKNDRWVGVAHGLNNEITFFDKRRHAIASVTEEELEEHRCRALGITTRAVRHGK